MQAVSAHETPVYSICGVSTNHILCAASSELTNLEHVKPYEVTEVHGKSMQVKQIGMIELWVLQGHHHLVCLTGLWNLW